jgi:hypothetical protein
MMRRPVPSVGNLCECVRKCSKTAEILKKEPKGLINPRILTKTEGPRFPAAVERGGIRTRG